MASVLVTDGRERAALATVRSLGRAGHRCLVAAAGPSLAGASRWCRGHVAVPEPLDDPGPYAEAIARAVERERVEVLIPVTEAALLALLPVRERLKGCSLPFPSAEAFRRISDKAAVAEEARAVGIRIPVQQRFEGPADAGRWTPAADDFPLVLKPARSVAEAGGQRRKLSVAHAPDRAAWDAALASLAPGSFPLLVQQRIVGPGVGIFLLVWDGRIVARFAHRRLREKPPSGGVSVYRESMAADPDLVGRSAALLARHGWQGVAMVEYKMDARSGTPFLMEVNGRLWGSLQLAIDAGVDFPVLLVQCATGATPEPVTDYRVGVRSRWLFGDLDHLWARMRHPDARLALPPGEPSRWQTVAGVLAAFFQPASREEVFRLDDPRPFGRELLDWVRGR